MYPIRISLLTLNLWNTELWDLRLPAVRRFLQTYQPDICCFQEVRSNTLTDLDLALPTHARVCDELRGWTEEGSIYFNTTLFEEVGHGAVDLCMPETDRRLVEALRKLIPSGQPALICGDFNDPVHPSRILNQAGFSEVFNTLGLVPPVTFPSVPITDEIDTNEAIDKIMASGPLRPLLATVPAFHFQRTVVSDHWPVMAVYELL
jgi:endonuclease/exonuclease/phosphatase family metal-dependent hydrolase